MWTSKLANLVGMAAPIEALPCLSVHSPSLVVYGCVLAAAASTLWALLERRERRACQKLSSSLSTACHQLTEQHYRERVQAEERHLLAHDSSLRNVFESLERALLGKPRS